VAPAVRVIDQPVDRRPARAAVAVGCVWLAVVAVAAFGALVNRPAHAGVGSAGSFYLVFLTIPAVLIAVFFIRTLSILIVTAIVAATWTAAWSWIIMHATSKHAAIGILVTVMVAVVIAGIGCGVDYLVRREKAR
jgi:hypothetical protein